MAHGESPYDRKKIWVRTARAQKVWPHSVWGSRSLAPSPPRTVRHWHAAAVMALPRENGKPVLVTLDA
eukprot:3463036-Pyramimonas_sp.AAC.1